MTKDMTKGSPLRLIIAFAVPMFLGMLFQQFYNLVDTVIIGRFLGVEPLAGVGSTSSLNFMVINFCTGACSGFAVPIAQKFGAKEDSEMRKYVANSVWLCVIFSVVITVSVALACRPVLQLLNTPDSIFYYAYVYILIIFLGIPTTFLYNMAAAVLRSLGDSRTPVVFLILASLANIVLDLIFILVFHMGVAGPAIATVLSQGLSGMGCILYMKRKFAILKISKDEWKLRKGYVGKLCYIGIPMGLQYSVTAIGTLVVQKAINGFGATAVAGVTAAQKINVFFTCPIEALGATMSSYTAQNVGANRLDRVSRGLRDACLCGFAVSAVLYVIVRLTGRPLAMLFLDEVNEEVVACACQFLFTTAGGYCLLVLVNAVRFSIQGMGFSVFAITAGVLEMIARSLAGTVLVARFGFTGLCFAHVLAWIFADAFLVPAFFYCRKRVQR